MAIISFNPFWLVIKFWKFFFLIFITSRIILRYFVDIDSKYVLSILKLACKQYSCEYKWLNSKYVFSHKIFSIFLRFFIVTLYLFISFFCHIRSTSNRFSCLVAMIFYPFTGKSDEISIFKISKRNISKFNFFYC